MVVIWYEMTKCGCEMTKMVRNDLATKFLITVKKHRLKSYGHISRASGIAKTILQGTVKGTRKRGKMETKIGRQYKGLDRMEFGESVRAIEDSLEIGRIAETSSGVPQRPAKSGDKDETNYVTFLHRIL